MLKNVRAYIYRIRAEEFFVWLRGVLSSVRKLVPVQYRHKFTSVGKLVPHSSQYPSDDSYLLVRDQTHFVVNRSDYVQWRLFYGVRDNALKAAKENLEDHSIVLDIGANIGAFSVRLARYAKIQGLTDFHIYAFEPNPVAFRSYEKNLSMNQDLMPLVTVYNSGLGSKEGKFSFAFDASNSGAGRVRVDKPGQMEVSIQRLDDFIDTLKPARIGFVKLIVEGFEPEVIKGGWNTLMRFRPPIFMEVTRTWWNEYGNDVDEVIRKLTTLGYTFRIEHYNEMLPYVPGKYTGLNQFNLYATVS
jgi:FkbM family methyltransferase